MESLVAMVLILLTMSIGGIIYTNVISSSDTTRKLQAGFILEEVSDKMKKEKNYLDGEEEIKSMIVKKRVMKYEKVAGLEVMELRAFDKQGKLLGSRREIISELADETISE